MVPFKTVASACWIAFSAGLFFGVVLAGAVMLVSDPPRWSVNLHWE